MLCVRLSPLKHTIFGINGNKIPQMCGFDLLASAPIGGSTKITGLSPAAMATRDVIRNPDLNCLLRPSARSMGASPRRHISYSDFE